MSKTITFASKTRAGIAYRLSDDWNWNDRGNAALTLNLVEFETFGDGLTQHSGQYCTQFSQLADACLSLAQAFCAEPLHEAWGRLSYIFTPTQVDLIAFVQTIKYREDKAQWYSSAERKVSSREACRHDRRWEKIEPWMDGGAQACASLILLISGGGRDWLGKLCLIQDLRVAMNCPFWEDMLPCTKELTGDWMQAFAAARSASEAYVALKYAREASEAAIGNTARAQASEEKAA